jgi:hypothetical protein
MVATVVVLNHTGMDADALRAAMRDAGIPEEQIEQVVTTLAPTLPEDAIRQTEACVKYDVNEQTMSAWVRRGHVRQYAVVSHKLRYISEEDVKARVERLRASA